MKSLHHGRNLIYLQVLIQECEAIYELKQEIISLYHELQADGLASLGHLSNTMVLYIASCAQAKE